MNRDTFLTRRYKTGYIHGCYDRDEKREIVKVQLGDTLTEVKSWHAAKIFITRHGN